MAYTTNFSEEELHAAHDLVANGGSPREVKAGLTVVLANELGLGKERIASLLGIGSATVIRMRKEIRQGASGDEIGDDGRGGRRRETLNIQEEEEFLAAWEEKAEGGGVLTVPPIHAALEELVGHKVALSTVYRMLDRHGWRKIAPDNAHPKQDVEAQEAFKKRASRNVWKKQ